MTPHELEAWMQQNPKKTVLILIMGLIAIGAFIGITIIVNLYDSQITRMFDLGASTGLPVEFHGNLYHITAMNMTYEEYMNTVVSENWYGTNRTGI